jgi:hypothetical protein
MVPDNKASTPLYRYYLPFVVTLHHSPLWYNLHSYSCNSFGEKAKGLIFHSQKYPFLVIHAKGGDSISPKQKDRTTTNFKKFLKKFSIGILSLIHFKLV